MRHYSYTSRELQTSLLSILPERRPMMRHLMPPQIPLILALFLTLLALNIPPSRVDVDDVLLQVELVAKHAPANGANAGLPTVPQLSPLILVYEIFHHFCCETHIFYFWKQHLKEEFTR